MGTISFRNFPEISNQLLNSVLRIRHEDESLETIYAPLWGDAEEYELVDTFAKTGRRFEIPAHVLGTKYCLDPGDTELVSRNFYMDSEFGAKKRKEKEKADEVVRTAYESIFNPIEVELRIVYEENPENGTAPTAYLAAGGFIAPLKAFSTKMFGYCKGKIQEARHQKKGKNPDKQKAEIQRLDRIIGELSHLIGQPQGGGMLNGARMYIQHLAQSVPELQKVPIYVVLKEKGKEVCFERYRVKYSTTHQKEFQKYDKKQREHQERLHGDGPTGPPADIPPPGAKNSGKRRGKKGGKGKRGNRKPNKQEEKNDSQQDSNSLPRDTISFE